MWNRKSMRMTGATASCLLLLASVVVLSIYIPPASASTPQLSPTSGPTSWAYGGSVSRTASGTGPNGSFAAHYFFAWKVIFTMTNTSTTTFQLEAQRTVAGVLYAAGTLGTTNANLTVTGWALETGFANFTTAGTVTVLGPNGTTVPAVAMVNENAWASDNLTETFVANWIGLGGLQKSGNLYASIAASANAQVSLQPSLGMFPLQPYTGEVWTSFSNFSASGEYTVAWHVFGQAPWGTATNTGAVGPVSVQGTGTVILVGTDYGTIVFGNDTTAVIGIAMSGTGFSFENHEGIILVPTQSDLYNSGGSTASGQPSIPGNEMFSTDRVDVSLGSLNHGGIVAASSGYGSSSIFGSTPAASAGPANAQTGATATTGELQGTPMTVSEAQAWCLYDCQGAAAKPNGAVLVAVLVVAAVAVLALVGAVVVMTRRRVRPTQVVTQIPPYQQTPTYPTYQNQPRAPPPGA
jgi:hypothetical protein